MRRQCMQQGCRRDARKVIKFHIFLMDYSVASDPGFDLISCDDHATNQELEHILLGNGKAKGVVEDAFSKHGIAAPDWESSYGEWVAINDPVPIRGKS